MRRRWKPQDSSVICIPILHIWEVRSFGSSTYMSIHQAKSYAYTLHLFEALLAISYLLISFSLISLLILAYAYIHIYIVTYGHITTILVWVWHIISLWVFFGQWIAFGWEDSYRNWSLGWRGGGGGVQLKWTSSLSSSGRNYRSRVLIRTSRRTGSCPMCLISLRN